MTENRTIDREDPCLVRGFTPTFPGDLLVIAMQMLEKAPLGERLDEKEVAKYDRAVDIFLLKTSLASI